MARGARLPHAESLASFLFEPKTVLRRPPVDLGEQGEPSVAVANIT